MKWQFFVTYVSARKTLLHALSCWGPIFVPFYIMTCIQITYCSEYLNIYWNIHQYFQLSQYALVTGFLFDFIKSWVSRALRSITTYSSLCTVEQQWCLRSTGQFCWIESQNRRPRIGRPVEYACNNIRWLLDLLHR